MKTFVRVMPGVVKTFVSVMPGVSSQCVTLKFKGEVHRLKK